MKISGCPLALRVTKPQKETNLGAAGTLISTLNKRSLLNQNMLHYQPLFVKGVLAV